MQVSSVSPSSPFILDNMGNDAMIGPPSLLEIIANMNQNISSKSLFDQLRKIASDDEIIDAIFSGLFSEIPKLRRAAYRFFDDFSLFIETSEEAHLRLSLELSQDLVERASKDSTVSSKALQSLQSNPLYQEWDPKNMDVFYRMYKSNDFEERSTARYLSHIFLWRYRDIVQEPFQNIANEMIHSDDIKDRIDGIKYLETLKRHEGEIGKKNLSRAIELAMKWFHGTNPHLTISAKHFLENIFRKGTDEEICAFIPILIKGCNEKNYFLYFDLLNNLFLYKKHVVTFYFPDVLLQITNQAYDSKIAGVRSRALSFYLDLIKDNVPGSIEAAIERVSKELGRKDPEIIISTSIIDYLVSNHFEGNEQAIAETKKKIHAFQSFLRV